MKEQRERSVFNLTCERSRSKASELYYSDGGERESTYVGGRSSHRCLLRETETFGAYLCSVLNVVSSFDEWPRWAATDEQAFSGSGKKSSSKGDRRVSLVSSIDAQTELSLRSSASSSVDFVPMWWFMCHEIWSNCQELVLLNEMVAPRLARLAGVHH